MKYGGESMTVGELVDLLRSYDENAVVLLAEQPSWPFEYAVQGVVSAAEVKENDGVCKGYEPFGEEPPEDEDVDPAACRACGENEESHDTPNVVYVVEGTQLRYGSKTVWEAV